MMRLVPKSCILSKFMELMIRHSQLRDHLVRNANGTSASMVKINSTTVVTSKIAYPELSEQVRILSVVTPYNKKLKIFEQESDKLRILKQALMQDLLTGKVRVPEKMMEAMP
jgi:type I restriction enzyme S subunit